MNRRWAALSGRGEDRIPGADPARMVEGRMGELEAEGVRVHLDADVIPLENELPELRVPVRRGGRQVGLGKFLRRRVGEGEERRSLVTRVAGPPADLDLLGVSPVAHDEVVARRVRRLAIEEGDREVEGAP